MAPRHDEENPRRFASPISSESSATSVANSSFRPNFLSANMRAQQPFGPELMAEGRSSAAGGRDWRLEAGARMPQLRGLIAGLQLISKKER